MVGVSELGYWPWSTLILLAAIVGCVWGRWYRGALFLLGTHGAGWLASNIKLLTDRPRPTSELVRVLGQVGETSYPSGHVTSYVVLYGFLFFLVYVLMRRSWPRTLLLTMFGLPVALVGVSRIYLGHHWASDVVGGYALGTAYLLILLELYRWLGLPRPVTPDPPPTNESPLAA
jgi:undecaprenyl-diphosphatase